MLQMLVDWLRVLANLSHQPSQDCSCLMAKGLIDYNTKHLYAHGRDVAEVADAKGCAVQVTSSVKCTYAADLLMLNCLATQPGNVTLHIEPVSL